MIIRKRKRRKKISLETRLLVYNKDNGICCYCEKPASFKAGSIEHITPIVNGGTDDIDNLRWAHKKCNERRGSKPIVEVHGYLVINTKANKRFYNQFINKCLCYFCSKETNAFSGQFTSFLKERIWSCYECHAWIIDLRSDIKQLHNIPNDFKKFGHYPGKVEALKAKEIKFIGRITSKGAFVQLCY